MPRRLPGLIAMQIGWHDDLHFLTIADIVSAERNAVIPNLLTWPGSAPVIDPKGTYAVVTATRRGGGSRSLSPQQTSGMKGSGLCGMLGWVGGYYSRPNCLRSSILACSRVRRRLAGKFLPARLIKKISIDSAER